MAETIDRDDLERRIKYHRPNQDGIDRITMMRKFALDWALVMHNLVPDGREKSLAYTKIEEALFWANAAIARDPDYWEEEG